MAEIFGPLVYGAPLLIIYSLRAALPDLSYDVLNHRLVQAERALRGPQFLPGDFFPNVFPFNPSSDMLTGLYRHVLGYRLGTLVSLFALIWAATVLEKMLRPWFAVGWQRSVVVLASVFTEHILFEVNEYMVDLLALPLLLEATRRALDYERSETKNWDLCWSALLLGGAIGLKLTNVVIVFPILLLFAFRVVTGTRSRNIFTGIALAALLFLLPQLPHAIYIYRQTGSLFFPLYNDIFHSPYWPETRMGDGRWGPKSLSETIFWPLLSFWVPRRLSELGVYAGRLTLVSIATPICLLLPRVEARVRLLVFTCLLAGLLWSATSGYIRYGLFIEMVGGALILYLSTYLLKQLRSQPAWLRFTLALLPMVVLLAQVARSATYVSEIEWGVRPIVSVGTVVNDLQWIGRDRDLRSFQSGENLQAFSTVEAWVVSNVKTNGIEVLLHPDVPMLGINYSEYFARRESRQRFTRALESLRGKRVYTLILADEAVAARDSLKQRNLSLGATRDIVVPFFSLRNQFQLILAEVKLPENTGPQRRPPGQPDVTDATEPLNDDAYVAALSASTRGSKRIF